MSARQSGKTDDKKGITGNDKLLRKEEPTKAPTPDKLDRAARDNKNPREQGKNPYPLTEEEATPNTPDSEKSEIHS